MATGNYLFHTNLNMQCPICPKIHMFDKCAGLNTSTCQYPVIVIAPPAGSRKFGTYKRLWHIPPIFITLNAYCSPFAVFPEATVGGEPGCEVPSSLLAALIRDRAPMVRGTLLNLLCLLLLLLGTEHRWCEDPIESALFIIRDRAPMVWGPYWICFVYYY